MTHADLLRAALTDLIARMRAQPHIAPCPHQMGPDGNGNPTLIERYGCICWIGPASDFLSAEVAALTPSAEAPTLDQFPNACGYCPPCEAGRWFDCEKPKVAPPTPDAEGPATAPLDDELLHMPTACPAHAHDGPGQKDFLMTTTPETP